MFNIEMTINGKPMTESNIKNELDQAVFDAVVERAKESVAAVVSAEEALQIKIDVIGTDIDNLSLNINGPDEIVQKIEKALSE